jgi:hypothetical protein
MGCAVNGNIAWIAAPIAGIALALLLVACTQDAGVAQAKMLKYENVSYFHLERCLVERTDSVPNAWAGVPTYCNATLCCQFNMYTGQCQAANCFAKPSPGTYVVNK